MFSIPRRPPRTARSNAGPGRRHLKHVQRCLGGRPSRPLIASDPSQPAGAVAPTTPDPGQPAGGAHNTASDPSQPAGGAHNTAPDPSQPAGGAHNRAPLTSSLPAQTGCDHGVLKASERWGVTAEYRERKRLIPSADSAVEVVYNFR